MQNYFKRKFSRAGERGYLMVGLVATMTISMIMLAAAAPQLQFQAQREREEEMLWRGQEISDALNNWCADHGAPGCRAPQALPRRLEELVEGTKIGLDQKRYLRPHALCDPLLPCSGKSNWRLVHPGDPVITSMLDSLKAYAEKNKNNPTVMRSVQLSIAFLAQPWVAPQVALPGEVSQGGLSSGLGIAPTPNLNPTDGTQTGNDGQPGNGLADAKPIVGVVSRSKDRPIRTMLDVENYDKELFFAGGIVMAGGFFTPYFSGGNSSSSSTTGCPGGLPPNPQTGRCPGVLYDGVAPPSQRPTK